MFGLFVVLKLRVGLFNVFLCVCLLRGFFLIGLVLLFYLCLVVALWFWCFFTSMFCLVIVCYTCLFYWFGFGWYLLWFVFTFVSVCFGLICGVWVGCFRLAYLQFCLMCLFCLRAGILLFTVLLVVGCCMFGLLLLCVFVFSLLVDLTLSLWLIWVVGLCDLFWWFWVVCGLFGACMFRLLFAMV